MTTTFNFFPNRQSIRKQRSENASLYLLMLLLGLLILFFAFWNPANEPGYTKQAVKSNEVTTNNKIEKADPATIYKTIVTNGDAIRSVLQ